jgi:type IV secretion system protein VirB10
MGIQQWWLRKRGAQSGVLGPDEEPARPATNDAPPAADAQGVRGERPLIPSVSREQSIQSRLNNVVAIAALVLIGGGFLFWYYSAKLAQNREAEAAVRQAAATKAAGEMKLAPLPRVDPPRPVEAVLGPPPEAPKATAAPVQAAQPPSPEELALQRKLKSPVVFAGAAGAAPLPAVMSMPVGGTGEIPSVLSLAGALNPSGAGAGPGVESDLARRLQPTATPAVRAQRLPTQRFLLPKGAFIDCTLETALDSTLPGMTTCITAVDIFGADGQVVLLERGTKLVGETRGEVKQGQARVFVLWTEARTPNGVVIALASPGTDALGRSGLPGAVDTHFWERFGAAILLSLIDGAVQAAVAAQLGGDGPSVIYNPEGTRDIMTEVLRNTVNIAPTVVKNQGERIQVLVARDADFRSVYALRAER